MKDQQQENEDIFDLTKDFKSPSIDQIINATQQFMAIKDNTLTQQQITNCTRILVKASICDLKRQGKDVTQQAIGNRMQQIITEHLLNVLIAQQKIKCDIDQNDNIVYKLNKE